MPAQLIADCPRCRTKKITFDVPSGNLLPNTQPSRFELFCICRSCKRTTIFRALDVHPTENLNSVAALLHYANFINDKMKLIDYVSIKDNDAKEPPEYLPENIDRAFREASACYSVACWNACAVMLRLCLDTATKSLLPEEPTTGLNYRTRRDLGLRLAWLFDNDKLPKDLRGLSTSVHQDGNDAAHVGSLDKADADDLFDFAEAMFQRIYTEPKRIELAEARRLSRRSSQNT